MQSTLDHDLLRALVALADTGSLTAAGKRLGLSQPAVHQQLARLSEQVGAPLYRREGRNLVLTPAGRRLVALGRDLARATEAALAELRGEGAAPPVICAGRGVWLYLLGDVRARPMVADGPDTVRAVEDGVATLGIAAVDPPPHLRSRVLWTIGQSAALPVGRPRSPPLRWSDLRGQRWVLPPRGRPLREQAEARAGPCDVAVEVEGWDLLERFVALGAGVTVVNDHVPPAPGVVHVPLEDGEPVVYRAIWRDGADVDEILSAR